MLGHGDPHHFYHDSTEVVRPEVSPSDATSYSLFFGESPVKEQMEVGNDPFVGIYLICGDIPSRCCFLIPENSFYLLSGDVVDVFPHVSMDQKPPNFLISNATNIP